MSLTVRIKEIKTDTWIDVDIPTQWEDMTLEWYTDLLQIIQKHTTSNELKENHLKKTYEESEFYDKIIKDAEFMNEVLLNQDIFAFLTGLDKESVKSTDINQVNEVLSAVEVLTKEYEPKGINNFEFEGETYYFPSEYLKQNTFGDFIETTQLDKSIEQYKNGRFDVLPEQMAILCRKEGEQYDDDVIPEKTEKFKKLSMDKVFEFAFFLSNANQKLVKLFSTSLAKKEKV